MTGVVPPVDLVDRALREHDQVGLAAALLRLPGDDAYRAGVAHARLLVADPATRSWWDGWCDGPDDDEAVIAEATEALRRAGQLPQMFAEKVDADARPADCDGEFGCDCAWHRADRADG